MQQDASDFMIQEYDRISTAYFGLRDQVNEWFKTYITLVGLPLTVLAAVAKIVDGETDINLSELPMIVSSLLAVVAALGLFVATTNIHLRMEMILYASTINGVRRFFADLDHNNNSSTLPYKLVKYLILPTSDKHPAFFEKGRAMFNQVMIIGLIDGLLTVVAVQNLFTIGWLWSLVIGVIYAGIHILAYYLVSLRREKEWNTRFNENLAVPND